MLLLSNYTSIRFINHKLPNKNMKEENDSHLTHIISHYASPVYGVAERLRENDYDVAGRLGVKQKQLDPNIITILKNRGTVKRSFLGIIDYPQSKRALGLAKLWINDEDRGATVDEKWVLEINKSRYTPELTELVKSVSSYYGVELKVIPADKKPGREVFLDELHQ
jgi:hypothetical protein